MLIVGALGRTRTGTALQPRDFKSLVSTIPPRGHGCEHRQILTSIPRMKNLMDRTYRQATTNSLDDAKCVPMCDTMCTTTVMVSYFTLLSYKGHGAPHNYPLCFWPRLVSAQRHEINKKVWQYCLAGNCQVLFLVPSITDRGRKKFNSFVYSGTPL